MLDYKKIKHGPQPRPWSSVFWTATRAESGDLEYFLTKCRSVFSFDRYEQLQHTFSFVATMPRQKKLLNIRMDVCFGLYDLEGRSELAPQTLMVSEVSEVYQVSSPCAKQ